MMRRLAFLLLRISGLPFLLRELLVQHRGVTILVYHDPEPEDLQRHLHVLTKLYNVIPLQRYLEWRNEPATSLPPKALVLTFDDGHKGNYRLRDSLRRFRVPATIFLCSAVVGTYRHFWWKEASSADERERLKRVPDAERLALLAKTGFSETKEYGDRQALSAPELNELKEIVDFQSHTRFHPILPHCTAERAIAEISLSKAELAERFDLSVNALAYPNGDCGERDVRLAQAAGYACALTSEAGYNGRDTDAFRLHRIPMLDSASVQEVVVKASGLWGLWRLVRRGRERTSRNARRTSGAGDVGSSA